MSRSDVAVPARSMNALGGRSAVWAGRGAWGLCLGWLCLNLLQCLDYSLAAIRFPYGIDYGEGIIWQQASLMFGPHAYGDILQPPFIVFHYPPLYHLLVRAASELGVDILAAGRGLSVVSSIVAGTLVGWLSAQGNGSTRGSRVLAGAIAGLSVFTFEPIVLWSSLMRVDLSALALSLAGVACIVASFRRPMLVYPGVVLFVLAAFTKQTAVAAPMAALLVALVRAPRHGAFAILAGALLGCATLAYLQAATGNGFLRHVVAYNLNRFDLGVAALAILRWLSQYAVYAGLAAIILLRRYRALRPEWRNAAELVRLIRRDDRAAWFMVMAAYLLLSTATLVTAGKSGAASNYFLEWMAVICIWLGVWVAESHHASSWVNGRILAAILVPLAVFAQGMTQPFLVSRLKAGLIGPDQQRGGAAMLEWARRIPGPILSDDMVLLMRAGKQVMLEPAIFAELAATGRWPEGLLLDLLRSRSFGAVVTQGGPGDTLFDARYLPATRAAITSNYGRVVSLGDYRVRLPN